MEGQEVRALNVAESTSKCLSPARFDDTAFRTRCQSLLVALRALFAFMSIAGMHLVAQASEIGLATPAVSATDEATSVCAMALDGSAHYRAGHDAPPAGKLKALEPQDAEHDVALDARGTELPASLAPTSPFTVQVVHGAPSMWVAQSSTSSALPRGPPESRRSVDTLTSRALG
jgi:hypothetical protein